MENQNNARLYTCPNCGAKFSPDTTGGVCPYCRTANPTLIDSQRRRYLKQQARKKQLKKAALRLFAALILLVALIVGVVSLISHIVKGNEAILFPIENISSTPLFYTDSDGKVYYVGKGNTSILIGKGEVSSFCSSEKNKITYFVFEGSRDLDALNTGGAQLLYVNESGNVGSVAEYPYGKIRMVQGGNCNYLYYLINETLSSYQSSSRLYLYEAGAKAPKKIADFSTAGDFDNFRVSPNGHYLLYKAQDDGGTKLMRYSVKSGTSESLGVKNAEPVSIDNKGAYYSYLKDAGQGTLEFYFETGVSDREKTALPANEVDRILISSDCRSFVLETGDLTLVKPLGADAVSIAARTGSGIGIRKYPLLSDSAEVSPYFREIAYTENATFFPYLYFAYNADGTRTVMSCEKDGTKHSLAENSFSDFVTNGTVSAFLDGNALYTLSLSAGGVPTLVSENFEGYTLLRLSENGKYIFYADSDGNVYRIPFDYTGRDWLKIAVDADPLLLSKDGRSKVYFSDSALYCGKDADAFKIAQGVSASNTYILNDGARILYLAESDASKAQGAFTLYACDGKKTVGIADNVLKIQGYPFFAASYVDLPYSSYIEPVQAADSGAASDTP